MIEGEGNLAENLKVLPVKLVVQVDDPKTELSERAKQIGLSCIRSVVIKHPDPENPTIFYDCPLSKLEGLLETNEKELKRLLAEQHQDISPEDVCLLHNRDSITSTKNIEDLFIEGDSIQETLELTLEIKPNEEEGMQRFCQKYDLSPYKQVIIKFLTGEFSFDILSGANTTIGQIKDEIYKAKSIPIHLQQLYHENIEVPNDAQNSTFIAQMMMISGKPITLNLIVKPAQTFKIYVKKDYYLNEQLEIEILETATILDFKEEISVRSGVPLKLIKIFPDRCFDDDSKPLWDCYFHKTNYKIWLYKIVIVLIDDQIYEGVVKREEYIIENKTETLGKLHKKISRRYISNVSLKSKGLKSNTLLNDLGETEITFVVTNRICSVM
uniref:Ubiquitin-like domain-containing protein n=1 Tax=Clytia hemisphaerica TaxID=252671 RepID=A0A7M5XMN4_9CNID